MTEDLKLTGGHATAKTASAVQAGAPAKPDTASCPGLCALAAWARTSSANLSWPATQVRPRLRVLRAARQLMAGQAAEFAAAISPALARTSADTLVTELLPLLDACKFLERKAESLLRPRRLGWRGRPLWLGGVGAEVHREPLGHVLVIGPANFPLFLPGVQVLQALAAGNTVTWKPGTGGAAVAELVSRALTKAGLPPGTLTVSGESLDAAQSALARHPDKVVFTGSADNGHKILTQLAANATPAVVELSGADALVVMPSSDLTLVAQAVAFGLRLNGSAVCMSPRRLFATPATMAALRPLLEAELARVPAVQLDAKTAAQLRTLHDAAIAAGALVQGDLQPESQKPLLITAASPAMAVARSDIFAPVISLIEAATMFHVPELYAQCPYALTVSIFCGAGQESKARAMAHMLKAGTVLINDVIAPTADPRVPFGGRGASGYGVTRGAEGLLEMTAVKTLLIRRSGRMRHLQATTEQDAPLLAAMIAASHGKGLAPRWAAVRQMFQALRLREGPK